MGAAERGTFVSVTGSGRPSPVHWSSIRLDISLAGLAARLRVAGAPFFYRWGMISYLITLRKVPSNFINHLVS